MGLTVGLSLEELREQVGTHGAVKVVGRRDREIGGAVVEGAREVRAPAGITELVPSEMTVRCGAGTLVSDLQDALAEVGQEVPLPVGGTVGGAIAVGRAGLLRLGRGPVRDAVLQVRAITAEGTELKAGGPTVKNVSGFDLCRLLTGSLGTLAVLGEVILRTKPRPSMTQWYAGPVDPFDARARLFRPSAVLWDGLTTWLCLEGHPADVAAQAALVPGVAPVAAAPRVPAVGRLSLRPALVRELPHAYALGTFLAEVGVGVVHLAVSPPSRPADPAVVGLHRRIKESFDPARRLNPGRDPLAV